MPIGIKSNYDISIIPQETISTFKLDVFQALRNQIIRPSPIFNVRFLFRLPQQCKNQYCRFFSEFCRFDFAGKYVIGFIGVLPLSEAPPMGPFCHQISNVNCRRWRVQGDVRSRLRAALHNETETKHISKAIEVEPFAVD